MIGWILSAMTVDLVYTHRKKAEAEEKRQKILRLKSRLRMSQTRGHTKKCVCRLCHNRRTSLEDELDAIQNS